MKYRKDFVTNSSSSSYVCEICGASAQGMDLSLREAEMVECVNSHTICEEEMIPLEREELIAYLQKNAESDREYYSRIGETYTERNYDSMSNEELLEACYGEEMRYYMPEAACPICQFIEYSEADLCAYLEKITGVPREEAFAEVKKFNKRRKKLYDSEYITYVCSKRDLNAAEIVSEWKDKFGTYKNFKIFLENTQ